MIIKSKISYQYNEKILEFIRIIEEKPILVLILLIKQYITDLSQTESKKIEKPKKNILPIKKVRLESMNTYITILTI